MSRELVAGQSGWGKSWLTQQRIEDNLPNFDAAVILDYADEYRGLVKEDLAKWAGIGHPEANLSVDGWLDLLRNNGVVIAARGVPADVWREEVASTVALAAQKHAGEVLVVVDEAHFVARMRKSTPKPVEELATTGRGQGVATIWVTQKIAKLDPTVSSQCDRQLLGGFLDPNDIRRVDDIVGYNAAVHNPRANAPISGLPDGLGSKPLQETDPGSEWIYATREGEYLRIDSSTLSTSSTHYGPEGSSLSLPE